MFRFGLSILVAAMCSVLQASCGSGGGGSASGVPGVLPDATIEKMPLTPAPTTYAGNLNQPGNGGGGACGLNGGWAFCDNEPGGRRKSWLSYVVISGCHRYQMRHVAYNGLNCTGPAHYERFTTQDMNITGSSSVSTGAKEVTLMLTSVSEEYFTTPDPESPMDPDYVFGESYRQYQYCGERRASFIAQPRQVKSGAACYVSAPASLISYTIVKVTPTALFMADRSGCTGLFDECVTPGERPTSFHGTGASSWR